MAERLCYTLAVPILLAAVSAALLGVSDYTGGRVSRAANPMALTLMANVIGLVGMAAVLTAIGDPLPAGATDLAWGAGAGLCGMIGVVCLYWALANGTMTVVAPATSIVAAGFPVGIGLALGERPGIAALVGMAAGLTAIALIAGVIGIANVPVPPRILAVAALAGLGFGSLFVMYGQTSDDSGMWPIAAGRASVVPVLFMVCIATRTLGTLRRNLRAAALLGLLGLIANVTYLLAVRQGLLSIVAVVVSLYPASTILLATVLDGERMTRSQLAGLWLAGTALVLVTVGS